MLCPIARQSVGADRLTCLFCNRETRHGLNILRLIMRLIMSIPLGISKILLPQDDLNVIDLVNFAISTGSTDTKSAPNLLDIPDSQLFSKIASLITSEEHVTFLRTLSIPTAIQVELIQQRLEKASEDEEKPKSLVYPLSITPSSNIRLPLWVLEYWSKTYEIVDSKDRWVLQLRG